MIIGPRKPRIPFDFGQAVTQPFRTSGGKDFVIRLLIWITLGLTLVYVVSWPLLVSHYGALLEFNWQNMQATLGGGVPPDPASILPLMVKTIPGYLIMMFGMWIVLAAGEAAIHRKALLDTGNSRRPLKFGKTELRIMLIQLCVWVLWFLVYTLGIMAVALIGGLLSAAIPALGIIVALVAGIALLAFLAYLPVRLAPAAALSVNQGRIHVLAARSVTKYRFWNLFLAYLVTVIFGYIAIYSVGAICVALATGNADIIMALSGMGTENPTIAFEAAAERFKNPVFLIIGIIALMIYLAIFNVWYLCVAGVGTYAVKWWRDDDPTANFD